MKKNLSLAVFFSMILLAVSVAGNAQSTMKGPVSPVEVGTAIVNLGIGVGANYRNDDGHAFGTKLSAEFGIWQAGPGVITLGGEVGASLTSDNHLYHYRSRTIVVAGRAAWHYGWGLPGLDTYGGFSFGPGFHHYRYLGGVNNDTEFSDNETIPVFGAFVGASYFVSPTFGFTAEAGYDITNFQVGIVLKLK